MSNKRILTIGAPLLAILVIGVGAATTGLLGGADTTAADDAQASAPPAMPPMPIDVDTARRQAIQDVVRATGRIEAMQAVDLRADESGRITAILFREGQSVAKGTPLIRIDDELLRAQAERADAERDLAQQQLERVERLRAENAASPADLERAQAAARTAAAALNVLRVQIERTTVRAPFAGVVGQKFVSVGDYATPATQLLTLQTIDPQRAVIEVPERHAVNLRRGQDIEFTIAAAPDKVFSAEVEFVDPVVQTDSRTILVKARAPNATRVLRPGMFIEAKLATSSRDEAVVVPEDAIQPLRTANVVWAVVDGKANRREVLLGARSRGMVEVLNGVSAGELVVVGGLERMHEGAAIAPQTRAAAQQ